MNRGDRLSLVTLTIGFLCLTAATVLAYLNPAEGYELSIYSDTPVVYWILLFTAILIPLYLILNSRTHTKTSMFLIYLSLSSVFALPIIRYHFIGRGDPQTHVGWTKDIIAGTDPSSFLYPGLHIVTLYASELTDNSVEHSGLLLIFLLCAMFMLFVYVIVGDLAPGRYTHTIAVFSGFVIIPSGYWNVVQFETRVAAILLSPVVLYCLIRHYKLPSSKPFLIVLVVLSSAMVIYHPQQALFLLVIFTGFFISGTVVDIIEFLRGGKKYRPIRSQVGIYPVFGWSLVLYIWISSFERFEGHFQHLILGLIDAGVAEQAEGRSASLEQLGSSTYELIIRLFLTDIILGIFAGIAFIATVRRLALDESLKNTSKLQLNFIVGSAFLSLVLLFHIVSGRQILRPYYLFTIVVCLVGVITICRLMNSNKFSNSSMNNMLSAMIIIMLLISLPGMYASPFIYQGSDHITNAETQGFETLLEYANSDDSWEFRINSWRYNDMIFGDYHSDIEDMNSSRPPDHFSSKNSIKELQSKTYIFLTDMEYTNDVVLYDEFRYSEDDFDHLDDSKQLNSIYTNGQLDVYYSVSE